MEVKNFLSAEVVKYMKSEIEKADGNEVFFTGQIDSTGLVISVKVGARGNQNTVLVNQNDVRESSVIIHNHPGGNLQPSTADLSVASRASDNAQGFYIVNNEVSKIYVVIKPILPSVIKELSEEETSTYISAGGALAKKSEYFEERKSQIELLKQITTSFNKNKIGVFEAGTGVGKSYAYLIPSVLWAVTNKERVVISTGTINLQQQICEKDLPAVEEILNKKIKFILMKGRQNYICLRRLNEAAGIKDLFDDETEDLDKIFEWAKESSTGSKSDLSFMPTESIWTRVNSESDACMGMRCPYHNDCFVMKVRKEASSANIIVVNHHLLFADIESRMNGVGYSDAAVLPPYRRIVFDEAHGIESAATSFFSESLTRFKIGKLVGQMYRKRKNSETGHLCSMAVLSSNEEKAGLAYEITTKIKNAIVNLELAARDILGTESTIRLYENTSRIFGPVLICINELAKVLGEFTNIIGLVMEGIDEDDMDAPCVWESKIILRRLEAYVILLKNFCTWDEKKDNVFWLQKKRLSKDLVKDGMEPEYIVFTQTPLDISSLMNNGVYEEMQSVVCTSATLKSGYDFKFWMNRTGINFVENDRVLANVFDSPFPYDKNMLFAVPSDAVMPDSMEYQQYIEMAIPRLISAANGRTLVLFTSYESLKSAYRATGALLRGFTGRILKQGDDDNAKLLDTFKREKESVLFATDSFWQGVDIPGESLSQVIIVKLPFSVPNDPVFTAKSEAITKRGGNAFFELSLPEAIIKFRQGIGRLIRRGDDKGAVVVLDRRIYEKKYGSMFIASMPPCKKMYAPLSELCKKITEFIFD